MKVIGLTGGIASGKSTVSRMLREKGAYIIDADVIAREIVRKGKEPLHNIHKYFGDEVLDEKGELNRKKLRDMVFEDDEKLKVLNSIMHPEINKVVQDKIKDAAHRGERAAVIDAALLIEMGLNDMVDEVWLVSINKEQQIQRLIERDNISCVQALRIISAQMPLNLKERYADKVIDNSSQFSYTEMQVDSLWEGSVQGVKR